MPEPSSPKGIETGPVAVISGFISERQARIQPYDLPRLILPTIFGENPKMLYTEFLRDGVYPYLLRYHEGFACIDKANTIEIYLGRAPFSLPKGLTSPDIPAFEAQIKEAGAAACHAPPATCSFDRQVLQGLRYAGIIQKNVRAVQEIHCAGSTYVMGRAGRAKHSDCHRDARHT